MTVRLVFKVVEDLTARKKYSTVADYLFIASLNVNNEPVYHDINVRHWLIYMKCLAIVILSKKNNSIYFFTLKKNMLCLIHYCYSMDQSDLSLHILLVASCIVGCISKINQI